MNEQKYDVSTVDPRVQRWVDGVKNKTGLQWLLLVGEAGTGKSGQANAAAQLIGRPFMAGTQAELMQDVLRQPDPGSALRRYADSFTLVIDDFLMDSTTPRRRDILLQILLRRHYANMPTIFTMQGRQLGTLHQQLDERMASRMRASAELIDLNDSTQR